MKKRLVAGLVQWLMQLAGAIAYAAPRGLERVLYGLLKVMKYRGKVVAKNLAITGLEQAANADAVYRFLARVFVETLWLSRATAAEVDAKVAVSEPDLLAQALAEGGTTVVLTGHFGNWEMLLQKSAVHHRHRIVASYLPLSNAGAELFMRDMRTRHGADLLIGHKVLRYALQQPAGYTLSLVADQTPGRGEGTALPFFGVGTHFFDGGAQLASRFNMRVLFAEMVYDESLQRYALTFHKCPFENAVDITRWYVDKLEETIRKRPGDYLWTHRRFKHDGVY